MEKGSPLVLMVSQLVMLLLSVCSVLLEAVVSHAEQEVVVLAEANG